MAKQDQIIEDSIKKCQELGIKIVRGPIFIWGTGDQPEACDCFGAVLVAYNKASPGFPTGWLKELTKILGKDTYWWWRFSYGFNQLRALELFSEEGSKRTYYDDEVSQAGHRLAKKLSIIKV